MPAKHAGAALLGAAAAALALFSAAPARAQVAAGVQVQPATPPQASPLATSPEVPWYYSALDFHAGGLFDWTTVGSEGAGNGVSQTLVSPPTQYLLDSGIANGSTSGNTSLPSLQAMSNGTDTNIYPPYDTGAPTTPQTNIVSTELPSYVLGNYRGYNDYTYSQYVDPNSSLAQYLATGVTAEPPYLQEGETAPQSSYWNPELVNFAPDRNGGALYNNFRDTSVWSWSSPFPWTINNSQYPNSETLDDVDANDYTITAPSSLNGAEPAASSGAQSNTNPTWSGPVGLATTSFTTVPVQTEPTTNTYESPNWQTVSDSTLTATNDSYLVAFVKPIGGQRHPGVINWPIPGASTAAWTFTVTNPGSYSLFVNIPNVPTYDGTANDSDLSGQERVTDAEYTVLYTSAATGVQTAVFQTTVSQTEANTPQYVAGPFNVFAGDTLELVLDNTTTNSGLAPPPYSSNGTATGSTTPGVVVADSATLMVTSGRNMQGNAAVINVDDYPEIANASYYGIAANTNAAYPTKPTTITESTTLPYNLADPIPFGNYTNDTGYEPGVAPNTLEATVPPRHAIRQLVYYGDSELETLTAYTNDGTPYTYQHYFGVVYCVDGQRGNVVWRYRCPDVPSTTNANQYANNGVDMTPVVTRINVIDPNPTHVDANDNRLTLPNKLVVIFGDQNGRVYCVDAIGNGILPANSLSIPGSLATNVFTGGQVPNQLLPAGQSPANITGVTNYSMPLDFDPTPNPVASVTNAQYGLNAWTAGGTAGQQFTLCPTSSTQIPDGEIPANTANGPCHLPQPASLNPTQVPYPNAANPIGYYSLIAGTTVYWVFRPSGTYTLSWEADDGSTPTPGIPQATISNPATPPNWTQASGLPTTSAVGGECQVIPALATGGSLNQYGSVTWTFPFNTGTYNPQPTAPSYYTVQVTIPPITSLESSQNDTRGNAYYVVQYGTTTVFSNYVSQVNTSANYITQTVTSFEAAAPLQNITVTVYNESDQANPGSQSIVADAVIVSTTSNAPNNTASNMPLPGAFNQAAPAIYVEPGSMTVNTNYRSNFGPTAPGAANPTPPAASSPPTAPATNGSNTVGTAYLYVVNSNGTLYSIDPTGVVAPQANLYQPYDIDPNLEPTPSDDWTPTANVRWWFSVRGNDPNNLAHIDSAPSILVPDPVNNPQKHRVFFGTATECDTAGQSYGHVYAVDSTGPVNTLGTTLLSLATTNAGGTLEYLSQWNVLARPAWSFPDAYGPNNGTGSGIVDPTVEDGQTSAAPALGDITGTPVPFWNPDTGETRIYFAADSGVEPTVNQSNGVTVTRPDPYTTGRIWSIGDYNDPYSFNIGAGTQSCWAYPSTWDPNSTKIDAVDTTTSGTTTVQAFPQPPIGAFVDATPAIGLVQFPREIRQQPTNTEWTHQDVVNADVKMSNTSGTSVGNTYFDGSTVAQYPEQPAIPMLYIGTDGSSDMGFYALDLDGGDTGNVSYTGATQAYLQPRVDDNGNDNPDGAEATDDTSRLIYRLESPNGFPWTSSPVLVTNAAAYPNWYYDSATTQYEQENDPDNPNIPGGSLNFSWGGGGAVFATGGNTLYQISATPVTNLNSTSGDGPLISVDAAMQGFGPLSAPVVASANVSGLENSAASLSGNGATTTNSDANSPFGGTNNQDTNPNGGLADPNEIYADPDQVTEWIFCADMANGIFRGITPQNQAFGAGSEIGAELPPNPGAPIQPVNLRLPLHAYIGATPVNSADMGLGPSPGGGPGGMLAMGSTDPTTFFDWGQSVYVRISNVVPPTPPGATPDIMYINGDNTIPLGAQLPAGYGLINGSPVSYTITEIPSSTVTSGTTFTDYQASGQIQTLSSLPGDGFITRVNPGDGYAASDDNSTTAQNQTLKDGSGNEYVYASTYFIGNGTGHPDTPGAVRRVINATQTCQVVDQSGNLTGDTVTLTTELTQGSQYQNVNSSGLATGLSQTIPSPDPTFGIANPLSIIGAGVGQVSGALQNLGGMGYQISGAQVPAMVPTPSASDTNGGLDMQSNGNFIYQNSSALPTAGLYINYDPTQPPSSTPASSSWNPQGTTGYVETDLGFVHDGTTGSNAIPTTLASSANYGDVALNMGDRSQVGLRGMSIKVNLKDVPGQWYDPSAANGPGARINPLPWEDSPTSYFTGGSNASLDYPNIGLNNFDAQLSTAATVFGVPPRLGRSGDLVSGSAILDPRDVTAGGTQNTYSDTVLTTLNVPKYQPANVTLMPVSFILTGVQPSSAQSVDIPQGYVLTEREFVDTNNNGQWDQGEAYRDFQVGVGVPINAATHMGQSTIDLGTVPAGFGVQMEPYLQALDTLLPPPTYNGTSTGVSANAPDVFSPYTSYFQTYFQPIEIYNDGNVNLLNVHLDQKISTTGSSSNFVPLDIPSDTVEFEATPAGQLAGNPSIPGYTMSGGAAIPSIDTIGQTIPSQTALHGATTVGYPTGVTESPFLLRSSLDTDLAQAYGLNPGLWQQANPINNQPWYKTYQGATFHKARPGAASPPLLTVPDYNPNPGNPITWGGLSTNGGAPQLTTNGTQLMPVGATLPYIGIEVPLGTPVGTYSQQIALFDGTDYGFNALGINPDTDSTPTGASPYPTYGGIQIGNPLTTQSPAAYGTNDTYVTGLLTSSPTAEVKVTVGEHRLTDAPPDYVNASGSKNGIVEGVLKEIPDPTGTTPSVLPDFYPAAVRDIWWTGSGSSAQANGSGDLGLLWSSARSTTSPSTSTYPNLNLSSAYIANEASNGSSDGFFKAAVSNTSTAGNHWWRQPSGSPLANIGGLTSAQQSALTYGTNFGVSIAQDQPIYVPSSDSFSSTGADYAFWVNADNEQGNSNNGGTGLTSVWCAQFTPSTGTLGPPVSVTPPPPTAASSAENEEPVTAALRGITGVRGLKYSAPLVAFVDPSNGDSLTNDLWAFWTVGGQGQSTIYYETGSSNSQTFTGTPLALPIPAGLSSVSDPSAVIVPGPDTTAGPVGTPSGSPGGNPAQPAANQWPMVPFIELTYSGTNMDGSSDIYVSRYRPALAQNASQSSTPQDLALYPVPYPLTYEALRPDTAGIWWSSRDIGWLNNSTAQLWIAGTSVIGPNTTGTYDKASGLTVYSNLLPCSVQAGSNTYTLQSVFADLPHGRMRFAFSPAMPQAVAAANLDPVVQVEAMARRVTAGRRPSSNEEPISFVDEAFGQNEAVSSGSASTTLRAQAARRWAIYRKSGRTPGDKTPATLWSNTQRLGIPLYNQTTSGINGTDLQGNAVTFAPGAALTIDPTTLGTNSTDTETLSVTDNTTGQSLYPGSDASAVDVDWAHGYIYFPLLVDGSGAWTSPEGHQVTVTFTPHGASGTTSVTDFVRWVDEPRFNDTANGQGANGGASTVNIAAPLATGGSVPWISVVPPTNANETAVPMQTAVNESMPWAFLDPIADADVYKEANNPFSEYPSGTLVPDQPHRVWLFWSSSRNTGTAPGTATTGNAANDLYYEALAPAFGAD